MKKMIIIISVLLLPMGVFAANNADSNEKDCRTLMQVASNVMTMRQNGTSLEVTLKAIDILAKETKTPDFIKPMRQITMDAYSQNRYQSKELQQQEINEFSAKYYLNCMKGFGLN
ncbi:hypothetical protein [Acinetobacter nosocomialis]|uniref:hypothetical protein n=1 Tax=Acinetobacter nosocomialis TaxID=106654 RepID=UPI003986358E